VKKALYRDSVGTWKQYASAEAVKIMAQKLKKMFDYHRERNTLPFPNSVNWGLEYDFDYFG